MILAILFAVLGYRKAAETGRNKLLWAVLMVVIFVGVQAVAGIVLGVAIAVGIEMFEWSETIFDDYYWPISIAGLSISAAVCLGVLIILGRTANGDRIGAPPPPNEFGLG